MQKFFMVLRELFLLGKPRLSSLVVFSATTGFFVSPAPRYLPLLMKTILATTLLVAAGNALNMYLERDIDGLMDRTANRPLPAKRLSPRVALYAGLGLTVISLFLLIVWVNLLTTFLGLLACVSYVLFYTPAKQKTPVAFLIGAIPGAIPPLMGWTAATNRIGQEGVFLFLVLFLWQIPHFLAIAFFRREEYCNAGIKVLPVQGKETQTRVWILGGLVLLFFVSLLPVSLNFGTQAYLVWACFLNSIFLGWAVAGFFVKDVRIWARGLFFYSLVYLVLLLGVFVVTRLV